MTATDVPLTIAAVEVFMRLSPPPWKFLMRTKPRREGSMSERSLTSLPPIVTARVAVKQEVNAAHWVKNMISLGPQAWRQPTVFYAV